MKRPPKPKPGTIDMVWVENEHDMMYSWGDGCRADARFIHYVFNSERMEQEFPSGNTIREQSVCDELEKRGYDLTTLKFSIKKKMPKTA